MGVARLCQIPIWQDPRTFDPDASGPIGYYGVNQPVTLTNIVISKSMTVEFGEEQAGFRLWNGRPLEVRNHETHPRDALRLLTIEISATTPSSNGAKNEQGAPPQGTQLDIKEHAQQDYKSHTAIISYRPSSIDWFSWSHFKSVTHEPRQAMSKLLKAAATSEAKEAAVWAALKDMKTDPFGNEERLYARFRLMNRTDNLSLTEESDKKAEEERDEDQISVMGTKPNRLSENPAISLAICREFNDCCDLLKVSELLIEALSRARSGEGKKHDGESMPITPTAQSLAGAIMNAAIIKALSGVTDEERKELAGNKMCQKFGSVAVLAERIFHDDLRNLHKRTQHEGIIQSILESNFQEPFKYKRPRTFKRTDIKKEVEKKCSQINQREEAPSREAWRHIAAMLSNEMENEEKKGALIMNACLYTAALAYYLTVPDNIIELLKGLRANYPLFVEAALGAEVL